MTRASARLSDSPHEAGKHSWQDETRIDFGVAAQVNTVNDEPKCRRGEDASEMRKHLHMHIDKSAASTSGPRG